MFYNQPLSIRFGTELLRHVDNVRGIEPYWDQLDIAVAWVRASGVSHLENSLKEFLRNGGRLTFIVGIDLQNTTKDGLQALLDLEAHGACEGACETFVYHNESGSVFHPKLYLFRNEEEARLIVGSNNLTAAGLYSNVEAGLQVDTDLTDTVIVEATDALSSWRDATGGLAARLDAKLLVELVTEGYVPDEATTCSAERARRRARAGRRGRRLFGARSFSPPSRPTSTSASTSSAAGSGSSSFSATATAAPPPTGTTMLMRLRAARGTQVQVPFRVASTFFSGAAEVISAASGDRHGLHVAKARGKPNTTKLEIPELRGFSDVFARFEKTPSGIVYEVHDAGTAAGKQIEASLRKGMASGQTQTSISDVARATWWREI